MGFATRGGGNGSGGGTPAAMSLDALQRLSAHRYSARGVSALEPLLQPYWGWLVGLMPLSCAPNTLTLTGLIVNAATTLVLIAYCPYGVGEAPGWCYCLCAIGLFVYQSLDAIDGKQARRTNSSSPLGELFDHGCDSLSIVFVALGTCITCQLGTHPSLLLLECLATAFVYYTAHWQTYCSAVLQFGLVDVTEGQIAVTFVYLLTALCGTYIWELEILSTGYTLKWVPALASLAGCLVSLSNHARVILSGGVGKNGSTVAGTSVLSPLLPMGALVGLGVGGAALSPSHVAHRHPVLFALVHGVCAAKLSNKLVVAHMSRSEMRAIDSALIGPSLMLTNLYLSTPIDEFFLLLFCLILASVDLLLHSISVCRLIASHLNIRCFSIAPPSPSPHHPPLPSPPSPTFPAWGASHGQAFPDRGVVGKHGGGGLFTGRRVMYVTDATGGSGGKSFTERGLRH